MLTVLVVVPIGFCEFVTVPDMPPGLVAPVVVVGFAWLGVFVIVLFSSNYPECASRVLPPPPCASLPRKPSSGLIGRRMFA